MIKSMSKKTYIFGPLVGLLFVLGSLTVATSASAFTLRNYQTGLCLAVAGVPPQNQQNPRGLVTWECDGTPGQQWGYNSFGAPLPPPPVPGSYLGWYLLSSVT